MPFLGLKDKMSWYGPVKLPKRLEPGVLYFAERKGRRIVVLRSDNGLSAFYDRCPHQGVSFNGGHCVNGNVVCPVHRYSFRLKDGMGLNSPGQNLELLEVVEREEGFYVGTSYTTFTLFGIDLW